MIKVEFTQEESKLMTAGLVHVIKHLNDQIDSDFKNGKKDYNRVFFRKEKIEQCQMLLFKLGGTYYTPKRVRENILNIPVLGNPPYQV